MQGVTRAALAACMVLTACQGGDDNPGHTMQPGTLVGTPQSSAQLDIGTLLATLSEASNQQLFSLSGVPVCDVTVYHYQYNTVGGAGEATTASGALMVPTGTGSSCHGGRPIVLYAHGTTTERQFNIANLDDPQNAEGLVLAAIFAARGDIVVAPNYAGYDTSTLSYHPFLNASQQSQDMINALQAARLALPLLSLPQTSDNGQLFVTGYSQGGFVAMATQRALQNAGQSVTAAAPMSGPYALAALVDAVFEGEVDNGAPVLTTLLFTSYQRSYGNVYGTPTDVFAAQYAAGIDSLLPTTSTRSQLYASGELPQYALFSPTPPAAQYASMTPATTPALLAGVFAQGFGDDALITNAFRLSYLQDASANPDGGFPSVTTGLPARSPALALRQDLKTNDLRGWTPAAPVLLCGGDSDPQVFWFNTQLMVDYWDASASPPASVSVLDLEAAAGAQDPYASYKNGFAIAKTAVAVAAVAQGATDGGQAAVLDAYHSTLVPPFCVAAVKAFFDSLGG